MSDPLATVKAMRDMAAELASLRSQLAAAQARVNQLERGYDELKGYAGKWKARAEAAERDAERYRWLRDHNEGSLVEFDMRPARLCEGWDAAIDAARAAP